MAFLLKGEHRCRGIPPYLEGSFLDENLCASLSLLDQRIGHFPWVSPKTCNTWWAQRLNYIPDWKLKKVVWENNIHSQINQWAAGKILHPAPSCSPSVCGLRDLRITFRYEYCGYLLLSSFYWILVQARYSPLTSVDFCVCTVRMGSNERGRNGGANSGVVCEGSSNQ